MKINLKVILTILSFILVLAFSGCEPNPNQPISKETNTAATPIPPSTSSPQPSPPKEENQALSSPVTMPVIDAMFADEAFSGELKSKLNLTDDQISKLKQAAREETESLHESDQPSGSTKSSSQRAQEKIQTIIGADKAQELIVFVSRRWADGEENKLAEKNQNAVPTDTRIVVNAPAFRMDIFKDGQLLRTYKIGIGYPEFPLPTGLRQAKEIIFNPTWTPPDEPWVESSSKLKPYQKVEAGSKLNPLGPIKIPIGLPSLIHGGKNPARLGQFASHGCVGLTSPQVQDFALALAQLSGTDLTEADVSNHEKNKTETKNIKLKQNVPVELRYDTIIVQDGKLIIYRDVYERGTNTEENLRKVLEMYGVSLDSLSEAERSAALKAVNQMAVDAGGDPVSSVNTNNPASNTSNKTPGNNKNSNSAQNGKVTSRIKGQKEVIIEIAALKGKGYPAPVDLNTGTKSKKPLIPDASNKKT
jgi:lipoprotein-anchoring transpeptidase ErfK/SrfK